MRTNSSAQSIGVGEHRFLTPALAANVSLVSQGGVGLAAESCLQHNKRQRPVPGGRQLHGERRTGRLHKVAEGGGHASPDEAQHPPLQGATSFAETAAAVATVALLNPRGFFSLCPRQAYQYGVYTRELLQFGDKVSMLLLLPPSEDFSSSYWPLVGTKEPGLTMPLQIFELGGWPVNGVFPSNENQHFLLVLSGDQIFLSN